MNPRTYFFVPGVKQRTGGKVGANDGCDFFL